MSFWKKASLVIALGIFGIVIEAIVHRHQTDATAHVAGPTPGTAAEGEVADEDDALLDDPALGVIMPQVETRLELADTLTVRLRVAREIEVDGRHYNVGDSCEVTGGTIVVLASDGNASVVKHRHELSRPASMSRACPDTDLFMTVRDYVNQLVIVPETPDEIRERVGSLAPTAQ